MDLSIQEQVELCRKSYEENVKPLIDQREYFAAALEFGNITFALSERRKDILTKVHSGGSYLACAQMLEKKLRTTNPHEDVSSLVEKFEAYQAQTKLPLLH